MSLRRQRYRRLLRPYRPKYRIYTPSPPSARKNVSTLKIYTMHHCKENTEANNLLGPTTAYSLWRDDEREREREKKICRRRVQLTYPPSYVAAYPAKFFFGSFIFAGQKLTQRATAQRHHAPPVKDVISPTPPCGTAIIRSTRIGVAPRPGGGGGSIHGLAKTRFERRLGEA